MGQLVDGKWVDQWFDTKKTGGKFVRPESPFRYWIGSSEFPAESGRYHLYISYACPWAHRTLIFRKLKQLEEHIGLSVVHPHTLENGWEYRTDYERTTGDPINGCNYHWQLYVKANSRFTGRASVPVLWDKKTDTIVNNESSEIIRMFNSAFDAITGNKDDYYPEALRGEIDALNDRIYSEVNNGVYRAGFATEQQPYTEAVIRLFEMLDLLEGRLSNGGPYLCGDTLTEADWRLFTTLIRFDAVYHGHFKCNLKRIKDYPALDAYLHRLYDYDGVAETVDFDHIKQHYYYSHDSINPTRIVPAGPSEW